MLLAANGTITSVSPSKLVAGSGEYFLTANGTDLNGAYPSIGIFDGPAGHFELKRNAQDNVSATFWIPQEIVVRPGTYSIVVRAVDEQWGQKVTRDSNAASFEVVGEAPPEHAPPTVHVPAAVNAEAQGHSGAGVTFAASATDAGGNPLPVSCDHNSGALFPIGATVVTCTASDGLSSASAQFTVTVADTTPPQLNLPHDIVTNESTVTYTATAFDLVDSTLPVSCTPPSGSAFPRGLTTTVQCSAKDATGNSASGSFHVTVGAPPPPPDSTAPVLHLPADITVVADHGISSAVVTYTATATDDVDGNVPVDCMPPSGALWGVGTGTVSCSAADHAGNVAKGSFHVTVNPRPSDTTPPELNLPPHVYAQATSPSGAAVTYAAWAFDDVDGLVATPCTPESGAFFPMGTSTVTCSAQDRHGNTATGSFLVTVQTTTPPPPSTDTTPPVLYLPADIVVRADQGIRSAVVTYGAMAVDDVDGRVPLDCTPPSGALMGVGTATANCSASDRAGNHAAGSFKITVLPRTPPDTTPPVIASVTASPGNVWPPNQKMMDVTVAVVATDDVDPSPFSRIADVSGGDFVLTGPLTLQLRAERDRVYTIVVETSDFSGNTSRGEVEVKVVPPPRTRATR
ncbi:MAG TPA: HYR domain-containing protein [Thermoanaerobaculia bacterium]|nr:HYR domain-containing protein [Thermoanaerobaculia bacterium]